MFSPYAKKKFKIKSLGFKLFFLMNKFLKFVNWLERNNYNGVLKKYINLIFKNVGQEKIYLFFQNKPFQSHSERKFLIENYDEFLQ